MGGDVQGNLERVDDASETALRGHSPESLQGREDKGAMKTWSLQGVLSPWFLDNRRTSQSWDPQIETVDLGRLLQGEGLLETPSPSFSGSKGEGEVNEFNVNELNSESCVFPIQNEQTDNNTENELLQLLLVQNLLTPELLDTLKLLDTLMKLQELVDLMNNMDEMTRNYESWVSFVGSGEVFPWEVELR